jgi:glucosamine-6-phosphate deaminase
LNIIIVEDANELAVHAANRIRRQIEEKASSVLGLATGSTPEKTYQRLVSYHRDEGLDFSQITTFNLDEYLGLPPEHNQSYHWFMHHHLFNHVNINPKNVHLPPGMPKDPDAAGAEYDRIISEAGGIDLQLLGVGSDGHIAFNEPGSSLASRTRVKTLTEQTIRDNARLFFDGNEQQVPRFALTMGVASILDARQLLLLASGEGKAAVVRALVEGPVTSAITASALQLHPAATVLIDKAAASLLEHRDYYLWISSQQSEYEKLKCRLAQPLSLEALQRRR